MITRSMVQKKLKLEQEPKFKLEDLPPEIQKDVIASHLDKQALGRLMQTSKDMYTLFKKPLKSAKLLDFVTEANYTEAEKIVAVDPLLMFQSVLLKYSDGKSESISPLKFAFKVYDTYMWEMFLGKIQKNSESMKCFLRQAEEQTEHVSLAPLFAEYDEYIKLIDPPGNSMTALQGIMLKIGKMQKEVLPFHMLKEFCREGVYWRNDSKFDVRKMQRPGLCYIFNKSINSYIDLLSFIPTLGVTFTLARATELGVIAIKSQSLLAKQSITLDLETLRHLFEVRVNDLDKQVSLLEEQVVQASEPEQKRRRI